MIMIINIALGYSKAVNSDDALTDERVWKLSAIISLSGRYPSLYPYLSKGYDKPTHGVVFAWLRDNISRLFSVNVKNSA